MKKTVVRNILKDWTEKPYYNDIRIAFDCQNLSDAEISNRLSFYINNYIERSDEALEKNQEDDEDMVDFLVENFTNALNK